VASPAPVRRAASACQILVVEDNVDAREMLREILSMQGHDVRAAADGTSAVALARERDPAIAIVDIGLPDIDGYEVARQLRTQSNGRIALVALTGYGQPGDKQRAL